MASSASPMNQQQEPTTGNLDRLKAWIDGPHHFNQLTESEAVFLWKPEFTEENLKDALIYALTRAAEALEENIELSRLAEHNYAQDVTLQSFIDVDLDEVTPANVIAFADLDEEEIRAIDVQKEKRFRRSIVALARIVQRIEEASVELKGKIKKAQEGA